MRLKEIHKLLNNNKGAIKSGLNQAKAKDNFHYIENFTELVKAISNIQKTNLIDTEISKLEDKSLLLFTDRKKVKFTPTRYNELSGILSTIITKISTIDDLVHYSYEAENEETDSLIVSFPNREISLKDMEEIAKYLNKTFKLLNDFEDFDSDKIKIQDFDIGSNWFIILLGTSVAVKIFGKIVSTIQEARLRGLINKNLEKQFDLITIEEEQKRQVNETIAQINLATYHKLADKLINENDLEESEELISNMSVKSRILCK